MFFHIIITTECNLQCKYCFGETMEDFDEDFGEFNLDYSLPKRANYDWSVLADFCHQDKDCIVTFYGGEPLLRAKEIAQVMDTVKPKYFMIQTNGQLLDRLDSKYVNRFHTILVSIDGNEELTDYYRGNGTFRKVINNLKLIKKNGFDGELIARMTVMERTDIYEQVTWLLNNNEFSFTSVHWQLNAGFWGNDYARRDFKRWSENNYIPGLSKLAKFWVDQMAQKRVVHKLYPFLGIVDSLLFNGTPNRLRCGGGWINYAIQTDGYIIPCPTMWGMKDYYLGHISSTQPSQLKDIFVASQCAECDILDICGGRCLYANITRRWSKEAYAEVCTTVRALMLAIDEQIPRIKELISNGKVSRKNFEFLKYNGCEIIP